MTNQPTTEYWPAEIEPEPPDEKRDRTAATLILLGAGWSMEEVDRVLREESESQSQTGVDDGAL